MVARSRPGRLPRGFRTAPRPLRLPWRLATLAVVAGGGGGGFPDASNTGVPAGTTLTPATAPEITTAGAVVELADFTGGSVVINANNVTLRKCRCRHNSIAVVYVAAGRTGILIEDCEIEGTVGTGGVKGIYLDENASATVRRANIHGAEDGVFTSGVSVNMVDSYIHDLLAPAGDPHYDCLQVAPGGNNLSVLVDHCSLLGNADQSAIVAAGNHTGTGAATVTVNNSRLVSINACWLFNIDDDGAGGAITTHVTDNRLGLGPGAPGYYTQDVGAPATWSGNVDDETGAPLPAP